LKIAALVLALALPSGGCDGGGPSAPEPASQSDFFESGGARLHFVLELPTGPPPFPAVVIGHGSGRSTTSDGAGYVPFLKERGFAVLRYDKRGVGQSTGSYRGVSAANSEAQIRELASDMAAALATLAARGDIDANRLGLMGTSQAGWVMVAAAERSPLARFTIAVTGSVEPIGANILFESLRDLPIEEAYAQFATFAGPPGYDPRPTLRALDIPTLWLLGDEDRLVPTRDCVRILTGLRTAGARSEFIVYAGEGHGVLGANYWPDIDAFRRRNGLP
jgi:pimeloyl-ACP methyl ester carboxylesterase